MGLNDLCLGQHDLCKIKLAYLSHLEFKLIRNPICIIFVPNLYRVRRNAELVSWYS